MTKERQPGVNKTERLQVLHRNHRWRDMFGYSSASGFGPWEPLPSSRRTKSNVTPHTVIKGDPKRRAKYRELTIRTQELLDQIQEQIIDGKKSLPEILNDLNLPMHGN